MEPWLQYATTADGVSIAYTVAGTADPLVRITGGLWDHAQGYWRIAPMRRQLERLAERFTHIQYDARGTGLSQRGVADFGLQAQLLDLEAVVAANRLEQFDLVAHLTGGFAAMTYAAMHPDRVSRLVLFRPHLKGTDYFDARAIRAMAGYRQMAAEDWFGYLGTVANRTFRFEHPDLARQLVAVYNESMTPETVRLFEEQYRVIDVSDMPERIECPTLIIVEAGRTGAFNDAWRDVASMIPNMSLQMVRADMPLAYSDEATDAILSFLGEEAGPRALPAAAEAMQVMVFISMPDGAAVETALREHVRTHGAVRFEATAGGYVAAFRSAQMALETAIALQESAHRLPGGESMKIGVDALDPALEARGAPSPARAGRVSMRATEGQVLVTDLVRQLVTGKGYRFEGHSASIENGDEPLRIFELKWRDT